MKFCFNRERFGLVHVNFTDPNRMRTPKWSMNWYKDVIETKKLSVALKKNVLLFSGSFLILEDFPLMYDPKKIL